MVRDRTARHAIFKPVANRLQGQVETLGSGFVPSHGGSEACGSKPGFACLRRDLDLQCSQYRTCHHFRVSARGDGSPYSTTFGSASSSVSRATSACLPSIGVDLQSPFVGQAVTMTVSTTGSSGTASSYQWQEWSSGAWTDLGATTTSATRDVSSATWGTRKFRVVVIRISEWRGPVCL